MFISHLATHLGPEEGSSPEQNPPAVWPWLYRELCAVRTTQLVAVACVVMYGVLSVIDPLLIKWILDRSRQGLTWGTMAAATAAFVTVYSLRMGFMYVSNMAALRTEEQLSLRLSLRLYRRLAALDPAFYGRRPVGDLTTTIEQDVGQIATVCSDVVPMFTRIVVATAAALIVMFAMNWRLATCIVPFIGVFVLMRGRFRRTLQRLADQARQSAANRTSFLTESLIGMVDAQLLGAENRFEERFRLKTTDVVSAVRRQRSTEIRYSMSGLATFTAAVVVTLTIGAFEVRSGRLTVGGYIAFYALLTRLFDPLAVCAELYARIKRVGANVRRVAELESCELRVRDPDGASNPTTWEQGVDSHWTATDWRELRCDGVAFAYSARARVLEDVDLVLRRGEHVAILGKSGSGKSTIASLLARLYDPTAGRVLLDGADIRSTKLSDLRRMVCVVPQEPHLFQGTLIDNATLGAPDVAVTRLQECSRVACFEQVVSRVPGGWEYQLGSGGSGLSDGEKQRLALLRGLLRESPILVLDETTSALDPITEAEVLKNISSYARDRCCVLITHRLSAALAAARIVVVRHGRIVRECRTSELRRHDNLESFLWAGNPAEPMHSEMCQPDMWCHKRPS